MEELQQELKVISRVSPTEASERQHAFPLSSPEHKRCSAVSVVAGSSLSRAAVPVYGRGQHQGARFSAAHACVSSLSGLSSLYDVVSLATCSTVRRTVIDLAVAPPIPRPVSRCNPQALELEKAHDEAQLATLHEYIGHDAVTAAAPAYADGSSPPTEGSPQSSDGARHRAGSAAATEGGASPVSDHVRSGRNYSSLGCANIGLLSTYEWDTSGNHVQHMVLYLPHPAGTNAVYWSVRGTSSATGVGVHATSTNEFTKMRFTNSDCVAQGGAQPVRRGRGHAGRHAGVHPRTREARNYARGVQERDAPLSSQTSTRSVIDRTSEPLHSLRMLDKLMMRLCSAQLCGLPAANSCGACHSA